MELWFTERQTRHVGLSLQVRSVLHQERTPYQELAVVDTPAYGRVLLLDGMVQTTEGDEFFYHEMLVHVGLFTHPNPRKVAVIGGGDGGAVREALKHPEVEEVTLVEIDERVVAAARTYLPALSGALADPRVRIVFEDGIRHVAEHPGAYDCVLVDSTEPVGAAVGLFSESFYRSAAAALREDGVFVAQTESPLFNADLIRQAFGGVRASFPLARLYLCHVPTYPSGMWSFTLGSKGPDPLQASEERMRAVQTRYFRPALQKAAFELPAFVQELVA